MPLEIIRNDITKISVDAIVNAANTALKMGGGVCGAIFSAAGAEKLQAECDTIGTCKVGEAVMTSGYSLPSENIIHTVGPIWRGGSSGEALLLHNCYNNSLTLALQHGCESIAFPLISSGIYGYPKDQALQIAISAISEFLLNHEMNVHLVVYDKKAFMLSAKLFSADTLTITTLTNTIIVQKTELSRLMNTSSLKNYKRFVRKVFLAPPPQPCRIGKGV